jgi:putative DNA primase/helicase
MINYDHALNQLTALGIRLDRDRHGKPLIIDGGIQRWKVESDDKEWRGWTRLKEWTSSRGNTYLTGYFGIYQGNDPGTQKIELPKFDADVTPEQRQARAEEMRAISEANKVAAQRMAAEHKIEVKQAAAWAAQVWAHAKPCTGHDYLTRKGIQSHGLREFTGLDGLVFDRMDTGNLWKLQVAAQDGHTALLVPMHDVKGNVCALQFIYGRGHPRKIKLERDKEFWPTGMAMGGTFGVIGSVPRTGVLLLAEGYATAASLHEATGYDVAYAFSANNLIKAAKDIRKARPNLRILVCADDDYLTEGNPGCTAAAQVTAAVELTAWTKPDFLDETGEDRRGGKKLTDYNDLAVLSGGISLVLANQIAATLDGLGWRDAQKVAGLNAAGGGGNASGQGADRLSLMSADEVVQRFSPVWSEIDVYYFDHLARVVVAKASIAGRMTRGAFDLVTTHPAWKLKPEVALSAVDFDPGEDDTSVIYNLWGGWPTMALPAGAPKATEFAARAEWAEKNSRALRRMLKKLCSYEHDKATEIFEWTLKWLAYPLQNPGAKMQSAILMHGGQGAGKNTFFDAILKIYSEYAVEFGPSQLEKRFNALFSKKMFALGNEVVASREDLYHVKGHIKHMITERRWVVEAKGKDERWERNCCNFVFLSNEINPQALEKGDRRHCVIWTPHVPDPDIEPEKWQEWKVLWDEAHAERKNGGAEALYHYLMEIDLTGFGEHTWPPMTQAKADLIDLNLDSRERFFQRWTAEDLDGLPCVPVTSELLHEAYGLFCMKTKIGRTAPLHSLMAYIGKQPNVRKKQENIRMGQQHLKKTVVYPPYVTDPPPGMHISTWLGDCIEEFSIAMESYRVG